MFVRWCRRSWAGFLSGLCTTSVSMVGFGSTLPSQQDDALRTFLPETAIKMVKSCYPRGGAREAGAADGVEIAPNVVHAQHGPAGDLMLGLASRLFIRRNGACGQIPLGSAAASLLKICSVERELRWR